MGSMDKGEAREQVSILGRQGHFDEATKCYDLPKQALYFEIALNESFSAELHVSHCVYQQRVPTTDRCANHESAT